VNGVGFSATGTIMSGTRPDDRRPGTEIFSNGNREGSNNFLYDGIDNNEATGAFSSSSATQRWMRAISSARKTPHFSRSG
jgi:hypothetical protein